MKAAMRYYCTYFDKGYLVRAIALHESLMRHERKPFTLFAVCLDELTRILVDRLKLPGVVTVPLHEIESGDEPLRQARLNRSLVEYYWTLTPTVILHLLEREPQMEMVTYLDADLYFFSSPEPIFEEFEGYNVLIHEHRFHEEFKPALKYGRFNVGLLCFRRNPNAMTVLAWWRERCIEWCYARLEEGRFGDQLYLEDWPERFAGVRVLEHIGAGVAPWNSRQYSYTRDYDGTVRVDSVPLIFYHFHALYFSHPRYVVLSKLLAHKFPYKLVQYCYLPYVRAMHRAIERLWALQPDFSFGLNGQFWFSNAAIILQAGEIAFTMPAGSSSAPLLVPLDAEYSLLMTEQVTDTTE